MEEGSDIGYVGLKDLKAWNIDVNMNKELLPIDVLAVITAIAHEKFYQEKRLQRLMTEKALKKHVNVSLQRKGYMGGLVDPKKGKGFVNEKLLASSFKSYQGDGFESWYRHEIDEELKPKRKNPMVYQVDLDYDNVVSKKARGFVGEKWLGSTLKSYKKHSIETRFKSEIDGEFKDLGRKSKFQPSYLHTEDVEDWGMIIKNQERKKNNRTRSSRSQSDEIKGSRFKKRQKMGKPKLPNPTPDLPQDFKDKIIGMQGTDVVLVMQKSLYPTDILDNYNRLSMPKRQMVGKFLTEEEENELQDRACMAVKMIEPNLDICDINFKQWDMKKVNGNKSTSYVFITQWNALKKRNHLNERDIVQIWSFRVQGRPCFALVRVNEGGREENNGGRVVEYGGSSSIASGSSNEGNVVVVSGVEEHDGGTGSNFVSDMIGGGASNVSRDGAEQGSNDSMN